LVIRVDTQAFVKNLSKTNFAHLLKWFVQNLSQAYKEEGKSRKVDMKSRHCNAAFILVYQAKQFRLNSLQMLEYQHG